MTISTCCSVNTEGLCMSMIGRSRVTPRRRGETINHVVAWLVAGAATLVAWKAFSPESTHADWHVTLDDGFDASTTSGRPMLVLYTADWCPACKQLEAEVLEDPDVADLLEQRFETVLIDLTDRAGPNTAVAQHYEVRSIPAVHVYDASGELVDDRIGVGRAAEYYAWLRKCASKSDRR
ncbi:MAG: thioredoxin fold domain-containing protein [Planctomycetota bacterium]|jgi:thiol:disulfide interchange protein